MVFLGGINQGDRRGDQMVDMVYIWGTYIFFWGGKLFFSFLKKRGRGCEESVMPLWKSKEVVVDRYGGRFAML